MKNLKIIPSLNRFKTGRRLNVPEKHPGSELDGLAYRQAVTALANDAIK
jgi:hypothetical protein